MTWKNLNFCVPLTKDDKFSLKKAKKSFVESDSISPTFKPEYNIVTKNVGNKQMKQILREATGYAKPKEMISIMGASGSGKTSLLNVLAQRLALSPGAILEGEVKCNNRQVGTMDFGKIGAFIQQDDILIETMTARESFRFAAKLRTNLDD
jgi:ABC-type multidrug transport system ATPase subunit